MLVLEETHKYSRTFSSNRLEKEIHKHGCTSFCLLEMHSLPFLPISPVIITAHVIVHPQKIKTIQGTQGRSQELDEDEAC